MHEVETMVVMALYLVNGKEHVGGKLYGDHPTIISELIIYGLFFVRLHNSVRISRSRNFMMFYLTAIMIYLFSMFAS